MTFTAPNGGTASLVLVRPLVTVHLSQNAVYAETDRLIDAAGSPPVIHDGAYLGWVVQMNGSLASVPLWGEIHTAWN